MRQARFTPYRPSKPPVMLRRRKTHLDNLALVPASLLPFKETYQKAANGLPSGSVLIVLPSPATKHRQVFERVVSQLRAKGQQVRTLPVTQFI